jgi:NAD(P)-dependent dehydrogenase (short-subunit alcohol dehydrogenase family)
MSMLSGRVAIVTGAGRGIGRAHALELARHGACVVVNDLGTGVHGDGDDKAPADEVAAEIDQAGGHAIADYCSVSDWHGTQDLIARAVDVFGRLDIVVNNAGIVRDRMITNVTEADFDAVIGVHLKGTFNVTKHAGDHWRRVVKQGASNDARIINTTSGAGLYGIVGQSAYGTAKAGIAALTLITAMEMERYGVTANAISPMALTRILSTIPSMRDAQLTDGFDPLDPANSSPLVAYLASPASSWLTGQVLRVEGNRVQRLKGWSLDEDSSYSAASGGRLEATELVNGMRKLYRTMPVGIDTSNVGAAMTSG